MQISLLLHPNNIAFTSQDEEIYKVVVVRKKMQ